MIDFALRNLIELASLPSSVPKLRSFILDQAVRGNLTADWRRDHPEVEPASVLLERIREEKRQLVQAGKIKKQKELPPVEAGEVPFAVPDNWEWVRLRSSIIDLRIGPFGSLLHKSDYVVGGIPVINPQHYSNGMIKYSPDNCIRPEKANELAAYRMSSGDLVTARRGELGRNAIVTETQDGFLCGTGSMIIRPGLHVRAEFLSHYLNAPTVRAVLHGQSRGATMRNLSAQTLSVLPFPVASPQEQTEIVRRVDKLMALCDQLEAVQTRRDDTRRRALVAGAAQLTDDTTEQPFADIWPRFTARLPQLVQHPDDIKPVQDAILQLAVRGHLTADWRATHPDTEPASTLIARIKEEKQAMVKAGKIKKQKELPPVDPEEVPFEVPEGWKWVRLSDMAQVLGGGTPSKNKAAFWDGDILWVTPKDMKCAVITSTELKITNSGVENSATQFINGPAILVVGRSGILRRKIPIARCDGAFTVNQDMKVFRPYVSSITDQLITILRGLESTALRTLVKYGMTVHSLIYEKYAEQPIPMPSESELNEIVRRVDELMAQATSLREATTTKLDRIEQLVDRTLTAS